MARQTSSRDLSDFTKKLRDPKLPKSDKEAVMLGPHVKFVHAPSFNFTNVLGCHEASTSS